MKVNASVRRMACSRADGVRRRGEHRPLLNTEGSKMAAVGCEAISGGGGSAKHRALLSCPCHTARKPALTSRAGGTRPREQKDGDALGGRVRRPVPTGSRTEALTRWPSALPLCTRTPPRPPGGQHALMSRSRRKEQQIFSICGTGNTKILRSSGEGLYESAPALALECCSLAR